MFATIAEFFGISVLRLAIYAGCIALALGGAVAIRQHYINKGWNGAMARIEKQNDKAASAAAKVRERADSCSENSWWDVVSASCKTEEVSP